MKVQKTAKIEGYRRHALVTAFGISLEQASILKSGVAVEIEDETANKLAELGLVVAAKSESKKAAGAATDQEVKHGA